MAAAAAAAALVPEDVVPQAGNGGGDGGDRLALWALAGWPAVPWQRVLAPANGCDPGEVLAVRTGEDCPGSRAGNHPVAGDPPVECSSCFAERPSAAAAAAAVGREAAGRLNAGTGHWGGHPDAHSQHTEAAFQKVTSGVHRSARAAPSRLEHAVLGAGGTVERHRRAPDALVKDPSGAAG